MTDPDNTAPDGPVAPADQVPRTDEPQEGVHPHDLNPDQPSFPAPVGVSKEELEEQGTASSYVGLPENAEVTEGVFASQEDADAAANPGDGTPYPEGTLPAQEDGGQSPTSGSDTPELPAPPMVPNETGQDQTSDQATGDPSRQPGQVPGVDVPGGAPQE